MTATTVDIVDELAGVTPERPSTQLRRRRPVTREQLQASHDALFAPLDDAEFPLAERLLVAAFATRLTADDATADVLRRPRRRGRPGRAPVVLAEAADARRRPARSAATPKRGCAPRARTACATAPSAARRATRSASASPPRSRTRTCWSYRPREADGRGARPPARARDGASTAS